MRVPTFSVPVLAILASSLGGAASAGPAPVKVLLVGDSLSVGEFGQTVQDSLVREYGKSKVCVYASCGSSPEHWTKGGFVTNCGFRRTTPDGSTLLRYKNGVRPPAAKTPKLRDVLALYRPEIAIVQLGTNWMDRLVQPRPPGPAYYRKIVRDFVKELRRVKRDMLVFWVLPPASSAYPPEVHWQVEQWINEESRKQGFYTINSRALTAPYRPGKTGGDGVHYNDAAGSGWARAVLSKFSRALDSLALAPVLPAS